MRQALGWIVAFALICIVAAALWALVDTLIDLYRRWACRREMQRAEKTTPRHVFTYESACDAMQKNGVDPKEYQMRWDLHQLEDISRRMELDAAATAQDRRFRRKDVN